MKRLKALTIFLSILLLATSTYAGSFDKAAETTAITKTLQRFVKGLNRKQAGIVDELTYSKATFVNFNNIIKKMTDATRADYIDLVNKGRLGGWKDVKVSNVDVQEFVASASVDLGNAKLKQKIYFTLVKEDNVWKVVSGVTIMDKK